MIHTDTDDKPAAEQQPLSEGVTPDNPPALRTHKSLFGSGISENEFLESLKEAEALSLPPLSELFITESKVASEAAEHTAAPVSAVSILDAPVLRNRQVAWYGSPESEQSEYALRHQLGAGGMGTVYEAHQVSAARSVAFKTLKPELAKDELMVKAFMAEGAVTAELEHPSIVPLYDLGQSALTGAPFYVMKQVRGLSWSATVDRQTNAERVEIMLRICDAIAFAHSRGVLHRDIKPDNVMLGDFGEVLVMDWGLAVSVPLPEHSISFHIGSQKAPPITGSTIGGTPGYMSPELAGRDRSKIGFWSDVYLLGATLWRAVTGRPPHSGRTLSECLPKVYANIIDEPRKFDDNECSAFGRAELMAIARKAMATEPKDRYASVVDFQSALRDWKEHTQSGAMAFQADQLLTSARDGKQRGYHRYALACFTYEEALRLWPQNPCAKDGLREARLAFATAALDNGDLELAESALTDNGLDLRDSDAGSRLVSMRKERACAEHHRNALQKAAEKWSLAFELSPDAMLILRVEDAVVLEANANFEKATGWSRDAVIGKSTLDIGLWMDFTDRARFTTELHETGEVQGFTTRFRRKTGEPYDVMVSACIAEFDDVQVVVANSRDISGLKAQESELRVAHERLARTQSIAGMGTWEYHPATGEMWWSDETYRILRMAVPLDGVAPQYAEYMRMVVDEDKPSLERALEECVRLGTGFQIRVRHNVSDGSVISCLARGEAILGADGKIQHLLGSVTETKCLS